MIGFLVMSLCIDELIENFFSFIGNNPPKVVFQVIFHDHGFWKLLRWENGFIINFTKCQKVNSGNKMDVDILSVEPL